MSKQYSIQVTFNADSAEHAVSLREEITDVLTTEVDLDIITVDFVENGLKNKYNEVYG